MEATQQAVDKIRPRRSRIDQRLNVRQRVRTSPLHSLRPCWTAFLISLRGIQVASVTSVVASF